MNGVGISLNERKLVLAMPTDSQVATWPPQKLNEEKSASIARKITGSGYRLSRKKETSYDG